MPTIKEQTLDATKRIYRMHEYEPGFQLAEATSYTDKADAVADIIKAARVMLRTAEARCNGIERYDAKAERSDERAEARIKAALATIYGATWGERIDLETAGDPRGAMVKLWAKGFKDKGSPRLAF